VTPKAIDLAYSIPGDLVEVDYKVFNTTHAECLIDATSTEHEIHLLAISTNSGVDWIVSSEQALSIVTLFSVQTVLPSA